MQIVISISEEAYEHIKDKKRFFRQVEIDDFDGYPYFGIMLDGTVLPKGHGRLIDADAYKKEMLNSREFDFFKRLDMQPIIIEADKDGE